MNENKTKNISYQAFPPGYPGSRVFPVTRVKLALIARPATRPALSQLFLSRPDISRCYK